jgi:hypothetical protein
MINTNIITVDLIVSLISILPLVFYHHGHALPKRIRIIGTASAYAFFFALWMLFAFGFSSLSVLPSFAAFIVVYAFFYGLYLYVVKARTRPSLEIIEVLDE